VFDVIIAGAGPAGSAAAKILADNGFKVGIIEKKKLPRFKACGGGVAIRCLDALKRLDVDINDVALQEYHGFMLSYKDIVATCNMDMVMGWGVYRSDFDYLITKQAVSSGAELFEKKEIIGFKNNKKSLKIITKSGNFNSKLLFGADGANSFIRKELGIKYDGKKLGFCLEAEIKANNKKIEELNNMLNLDLSYLDEGYAWIFPKKHAGTVNIGVGTYLRTAQRPDISLKEVLLKFIKDKGFKINSEKFFGALIPFGGSVSPLGKENVILLGDAAGLVSPMSGEGIPYALDSGILSAECAKKYFEINEPLVDNYSDSISHLTKEISEYAISLQKKLYGNDKHRELVVKMCSRNNKLFDTIGKIFLHIIPYEDGIKELSTYKLLPKILDVWYSDSIFSPIGDTTITPLSKWVRM